MQMPEPSWETVKLREDQGATIRGFEHSTYVLIPGRRYRQDVAPQPVDESPSIITVGTPDRHGALLTVTRYGPRAHPTAEEVGEMTGELAESWALMTLIPKPTP